MRNKCVQISLYDTYKSVAANMEDDKPKLFRLLDEYIAWDKLIPARFYHAFYQRMGRPRKYPLEGFLKSMVLQKIFGYVDDSVLLATLRYSREMRAFCGFEKVPDGAKLTRFKQDFLPYIIEVFERLVELTEPICRAMDAELADCLIFDTTGIESYVAENNPKFMTSKLRQAKALAKFHIGVDIPQVSGGLLDHRHHGACVAGQAHEPYPPQFCHQSGNFRCDKPGVQPLVKVHPHLLLAHAFNLLQAIVTGQHVIVHQD